MFRTLLKIITSSGESRATSLFECLFFRFLDRSPTDILSGKLGLQFEQSLGFSNPKLWIPLGHADRGTTTYITIQSTVSTTEVNYVHPDGGQPEMTEPMNKYLSLQANIQTAICILDNLEEGLE